MPSDTTQLHSNIPPPFIPPESHFQPEIPLSFSTDIWSLACTIFNIMGRCPPFYTDSVYDTTGIEERVMLLGKLPSEWWGKWDARSRLFNEDGTRNNRKSEEELSWEEQFEKYLRQSRPNKDMEVMGDKEKDALSTMLKAMLRYRPSERPTAREVMESEWMEEWALPEVERMKELRQGDMT